jgi:hypothetical protein
LDFLPYDFPFTDLSDELQFFLCPLVRQVK